MSSRFSLSPLLRTVTLKFSHHFDHIIFLSSAVPLQPPRIFSPLDSVRNRNSKEAARRGNGSLVVVLGDSISIAILSESYGIRVSSLEASKLFHLQRWALCDVRRFSLGFGSVVDCNLIVLQFWGLGAENSLHFQPGPEELCGRSWAN